jgi:uncharacterized protein YjbI with pentapeptide repeats
MPLMSILVIAVGAVVAMLLALWLVPWLQTMRLDREKEDHRFLAQNEARRTIAQIIGGLAILTGLYFTNETLRVSSAQNVVALQQADLAKKQFALAQSGQVTDRFSRATDQLGSHSIAIRLGAILAFDRVSRDSSEDNDSWSVMTLLTSWVQAAAPWPPSVARPASKIPADIQAALAVVADRDTRKDSDGEMLDLSNSDLRGAYLVEGHLSNIDLSNAHLEKADLSGACFDGSSRLLKNSSGV